MTGERPGRPLGSLGWRLLAAFALVAVGTVGLVVAAALVGTGRGIDQATESGRARVAVTVAAAVADAYRAADGWDGADLTEAEALAAAAGARLVIIAADGTIVTGADATAASSVGSSTAADDAATALARAVPALIPAASRSPERASTPGPTGSGPPDGPSGEGTPSARPSASGSDRPGNGTTPPSRSPTAAPQMPSSGVPVVVDGVPVGVVGLVFGTDPATTARDVAWRWIAVAAAGALLLALLAGLVVTRRIARPLMAVAGTAQAFAAGDRAVRTGVTGPGEIGTVARSVDDMADTVARSESSQRRLASNVAHELRTPLAALQVGLEELRDGLVEPDAELLTGLHDQALRLGRLVDDLTALSSAEATAFSLRWAEVDLAALATSETAAQEPRLRAAGLTVTTETAEPVWVEGDADRLRQVLANLLSNAARYCHPGDEVRVSVVAVDRIAQLVVRDTGPGIAAADLPHVFDRFWRGTASGGAQGLGLGLAVVRELVTAHHGTVHVDSDGSTGTSVVVELPLPAGRR